MTSSYWEEKLEVMNRGDLEALQVERLRATVAQAAHSPYYKKVFAEQGISADSITSLDDLKKLPFITKEDLRANYPFGLAAIPLQQCVRVHSSSGTTGNPTVVLHSQKDLDAWANRDSASSSPHRPTSLNGCNPLPSRVPVDGTSSLATLLRP